MERHLGNAPITEALVDIVVEPKTGLGYSDVEKAFREPDFGYYVKNPISEGTFAFGFGQDGQPIPPTSESGLVGLRLHSKDEKYVLQVRPNRFTLSRLPPYEDWATLVFETKRVWAIFSSRLKPRKATRIAARYINNLRLPMHAGDSFQEFIQKMVNIPDGAPQAVEGFLQRFQLFDVESGVRVILTLTLEGLAPDGIAPVMLDVDAFKMVNLSPYEAEIWTELEKIKELKNRSFFGSLAERALELYK